MKFVVLLAHYTPSRPPSPSLIPRCLESSSLGGCPLLITLVRSTARQFPGVQRHATDPKPCRLQLLRFHPRTTRSRTVIAMATGTAILPPPLTRIKYDAHPGGSVAGIMKTRLLVISSSSSSHSGSSMLSPSRPSFSLTSSFNP